MATLPGVALLGRQRLVGVDDLPAAEAPFRVRVVAVVLRAPLAALEQEQRLVALREEVMRARARRESDEAPGANRPR